MSFLAKLLGKPTTSPIPIIEAMDAIAARVHDENARDKRFVALSVLGANEVLQNLAKSPIPNALVSDSFSAQQYLHFYKIVCAYYWMMLFIHDRRAKSYMRRLLSKITATDQADTDRLCDDFETAFQPSDPDDPRFTLGKVAWSKIRSSLPTNKTSESLVHIGLPMMFDNFRDTVADLFV